MREGSVCLDCDRKCSELNEDVHILTLLGYILAPVELHGGASDVASVPDYFVDTFYNFLCSTTLQINRTSQGLDFCNSFITSDLSRPPFQEADLQRRSTQSWLTTMLSLLSSPKSLVQLPQRRVSNLLFPLNKLLTASQARRHLEANSWDLSVATTEYFTALDENYDSDDNAQKAQQAPQEPYTGPRTLDGQPAPQSVSAAAPSSRSAPKQRGIATLGSMGSGGGHGHAHDDDDDSSEDERDKPRDLFAGGEKSGLAVQDPSKKDSKGLINDILKKARE